MTTASAKLTKTKYGSHKLEVNTLVPNPFENKCLLAAINVIGDARLEALDAKGKANNWSRNRLESEIRNLAEEVASTNDREDD